MSKDLLMRCHTSFISAWGVTREGTVLPGDAEVVRAHPASFVDAMATPQEVFEAQRRHRLGSVEAPKTAPKENPADWVVATRSLNAIDSGLRLGYQVHEGSRLRRGCAVARRHPYAFRPATDADLAAIQPPAPASDIA